MSDLTDLMDAGFDLIADQAGNVIAYNGQSAACIATPVSKTQTLRDAGILAGATCVVEMKRAAFASLGLELRDPAGRSVVVTIDGESLRLIGIEPDAADPIIRLSFAAL